MESNVGKKCCATIESNADCRSLTDGKAEILRIFLFNSKGF